MIPDSRYAEIEQRLKAITPGEWTASHGYDGGATVAMMRDWRRGSVGAQVLGPEAWIHSAPLHQPDLNAEFIAAAPSDVRFLLDDNTRLRERLEQQDAEIARLTERLANDGQ